MKTPTVVLLSFFAGIAVAQAGGVPLFPAPQLGLPGAASSAATGDFNADGRLDIAATVGNGVSVFLSQGLGSFSSAAHYAAGLGCRAVEVGDLDGDTHLDLIVASQNSNDVSILRGDGEGGFGLPTHQTVGVEPSDLVAADIDQDGFLDVAVVNEASANVVILFGNGTGQFSTSTQYPVGVRPIAVVTADFNIDGRPDLAVANSGSNSVTVLLNQGAGSLGALPPFTVGTAPMSIATGDLNLDGLPDLATADRTSNTASLLLSIGTGNFASAESVAVDFISPLAIAIADLTGDGYDDLVIGGVPSLIVMYPNDGLGGLHPPVLAEAGNFVSTNLITSDLNGDSSTDLAIAGTHMSLLLNDGTGRLGAEAFVFPAGFYVGIDRMSSGDMNADGHLDILRPGYNTDDVTIFHGDGVAGFSVATTIALAPNSEIRSVAAGEFTSDSMRDFVVAAKSPGLDVFIQTSPGTYLLTQVPLTPPQAVHYNVFVEDVDNDGEDDVVAMGYPYTYYLLGDGAGSFTQLPAIPGMSASNVGFADLNGDGRSDLVTRSGDIHVYIATAPGTFLPPTDYVIGGGSFALRDLNDDGYPDFLSASGGRLYVAQNDGLGGFPNVTYIDFNPTSEYTAGVSSGDFDGDGDVDAVVLESTIAFFLPGAGDGTFHDPVPFAGANGGGSNPLVVDVNHDGRVDLVMPDRFGVAVLMPDPAPRGSIEVYGAGCQGTGGFLPSLSLGGCPAPGGVLQLSIQGALGGSFALVLFGPSPGSTSLGNGCYLLLSQVVPPGATLPLSGFLPGTGTFSGSFSVPSSSGGFAISMQAFVSDGGVAQGYSNTNGVNLTVR